MSTDVFKMILNGKNRIIEKDKQFKTTPYFILRTL